MFFLSRFATASLVAILLFPVFCASAVGDKFTAPITDIHRAITQDSEWLNTSRSLKPEDLRGRIILLDFWTFCCINCIHVMPDLKALETQFPKDLTVIGVHSAKFNNEKDTENIRNAILRYDLHHPVVNDASFRIWESFQVQAWPTLVLINPLGKVARVFPGEGQKENVAQAIMDLQRKFAGKINHSPLPIDLERDKAPPSVLSFPGKIVYVPDFEKAPILFVSDSSHNRIAGVRLDGEIVVSIGKKDEAALRGGDFSEARFNKPQGVLYEPGFLYVADTGNHSLRKINLNTKKVETLAGTGQIGNDRSVKEASALATSMNSPWDLAFYPDGNHITIAMAGLHQLWSYDKEKKTVSVIAGDGRESIVDGSYPENSLAQTSGITTVDDALYFVDSETSSLRVLENGKVKTLIGSGLFDFGFKDGKQGTGLLQHDIGVASHGDGVFIADSYNHSIRRYDFKTQTLETVAGTNIRGNHDGSFGETRFNEPNGIAFNNDVAYITDTNNNQIRIMDLNSKKVTTLSVFEKTPISVKLTEKLPNLKKDGQAMVQADVPLNVSLKLDQGWHINKDAPSYLALFKIEEKNKSSIVKVFERKELQTQNVILPSLKSGGKYRLQGTFYYCEIKEGSSCQLQSHDLTVQPVTDGNKSRDVELDITSVKTN